MREDEGEGAETGWDASSRGGCGPRSTVSQQPQPGHQAYSRRPHFVAAPHPLQVLCLPALYGREFWKHRTSSAALQGTGARRVSAGWPAPTCPALDQTPR